MARRRRMSPPRRVRPGRTFFLRKKDPPGPFNYFPNHLTEVNSCYIFNHMVKCLGHLDTTFAALADPTRRAILARLSSGGASVTEIAEPFDMSLPAVSKHLRVLERAGMLARTRDGRVHRLRLVADPMQEAAEWIARYREFWEGALDSLADYLEDPRQDQDA